MNDLVVRIRYKLPPLRDEQVAYMPESTRLTRWYKTLFYLKNPTAELIGIDRNWEVKNGTG